MDRKKIVDKHSPVVKKVDLRAPFSVGNGDFGLSVDVTGLQSFMEEYKVPLSTQSNWGWHSTGGNKYYTDKSITYQKYDSNGRQVAYPMFPGRTASAYHWLRRNPHRLQLGQLGFRFTSKNGVELPFSALESINQKLDLWTGIIHSSFEIEGNTVSVQTACHPDEDIVAVKVTSKLITEGRLEVFIRFPNPNINSNTWEDAIYPEWDSTGHETKLVDDTANSALIRRDMDHTNYHIKVDFSSGKCHQIAVHQLNLSPDNSKDYFSFTASFAPTQPKTIEIEDVFEESKRFWSAYWLNGAMISFDGSSDPRADELERRVILSQYLTAIHSSGKIPPQETGFMYNSWFGKFHLEMHWWHAAHFPMWKRPSFLLKSMEWYLGILPKARNLAASQGYEGARWPKMVGVEGEQTPSAIAPGLIWQQPHPISMAELCYQAEPSEDFLNKYKELVFATADFMVSYANWNQAKKTYELGPPLIPAQECHAMEDSKNPPFELEYWKYGLEIASKWARRLGVQPNRKWVEVAAYMAEPPQMDGVYIAHENCPETFKEKNHDHPSMVGALGILPGKLINKEVMRKTLFKVKDEWQWNTAWGWDFPMCAMTAARLGERKLAVDFLLMEEDKNTYLVNGHNYQNAALSSYLPGNGGLLIAIAMMVTGWDNTTEKYPGFPDDGTWKIEIEGF